MELKSKQTFIWNCLFAACIAAIIYLLFAYCIPLLAPFLFAFIITALITRELFHAPFGRKDADHIPV